jgi:hypothetical protein
LAECQIRALGQHFGLECFTLGICVGYQLVPRILAFLISVGMPAGIDDRERITVICWRRR